MRLRKTEEEFLCPNIWIITSAISQVVEITKDIYSNTLFKYFMRLGLRLIIKQVILGSGKITVIPSCFVQHSRSLLWK